MGEGEGEGVCVDEGKDEGEGHRLGAYILYDCVSTISVQTYNHLGLGLGLGLGSLIPAYLSSL